MSKSDCFYLRVVHADRPDRPDDPEILARLIEESEIAGLAYAPRAHPRGGWELQLTMADKERTEIIEYLHKHQYRAVI